LGSDEDRIGGGERSNYNQKEGDMKDQVAKSNRMVQGRMDWSRVQHRIVAMLVAQIEREDEQFRMQRVEVKELLGKSGTKGNGLYSKMEGICQKLLESRIEVRDHTADGKRRYRGISPFSSCEYVEGEGAIRARFTEDMRPYLLQLRKRFTTYQLENLIRLESRHSMRIYEVLKMREGLGRFTWTVEDFRRFVGCEEKYKRFVDFRRRVIDPAQKEIKEKCDLSFKYKVERKGRTPVRLHFWLEEEREGPKFNVRAMLIDRIGEKRVEEIGEEKLSEELEEAAERVNDDLPKGLRANQQAKIAAEAIRGG
jgi:plasmid replication initiation protein